MSHAMALEAGIGGQGLWSVSRGLARGLTDRGDYKRMMDMADTPRRGDRDGRGNLSEAALKTYCEWFLKVTLDQINFSAKLLDRGGLERRYRRLVEDTVDDKRAPDLIFAVLRCGALERGGAQIVFKTSEPTARNTQHAEQAGIGWLPVIRLAEDTSPTGVSARLPGASFPKPVR